jgi:hypothetical protein
MHRCRTTFAWGLLLLTATLSTPFAAHAADPSPPPTIVVYTWPFPQQPLEGCPEGTGGYGYSSHFFDCETGAPPSSGLSCENAAAADAPYCAYYNVCLASPPAPMEANTCSNTQQPGGCKGKTGSATNDGLSKVGDPVDLTSGALELFPEDVDLGHGLRFARFYTTARTRTGPMGRAWQHSLEWRLTRKVVPSQNLVILIVKEPFRAPIAYIQASPGAPFTTGSKHAGTVTLDPDGVVHFISEEGVEADFDASNQLTALRLPGERQINVTVAGSTTTYSNGNQTLAVTINASGRVANVVANGETWSYAYDSSQNLTTVTGPDPTTSSTSDLITWTYVYTTPVSSGRVTRLDRTTLLGTTTLGSWAYSGGRVVSVDEPALAQPLLFSYVVPEANRLQATVKNSSNEVLALFDSTNNAVSSVTNASGPAAPVVGGAGVPVPYVANTTELVGTKTNNRFRTRTDPRGNVTLTEAYDAHDRPGRTVEGWVDGPTQPGVFSPDDTYARLTETTWHPVLNEPLTIAEPSVLSPGGTRTTIFDYDDPAAPGDDPAIPNQAPTKRLFSRTEQGYTLDATGAVVTTSSKVTYTYL